MTRTFRTLVSGIAVASLAFVTVSSVQAQGKGGSRGGSSGGARMGGGSFQGSKMSGGMSQGAKMASSSTGNFKPTQGNLQPTQGTFKPQLVNNNNAGNKANTVSQKVNNVLKPSNSTPITTAGVANKGIAKVGSTPLAKGVFNPAATKSFTKSGSLFCGTPWYGKGYCGTPWHGKGWCGTGHFGHHHHCGFGFGFGFGGCWNPCYHHGCNDYPCHYPCFTNYYPCYDYWTPCYTPGYTVEVCSSRVFYTSAVTVPAVVAPAVTEVPVEQVAMSASAEAEVAADADPSVDASFLTSTSLVRK